MLKKINTIRKLKSNRKTRARQTLQRTDNDDFSDIPERVFLILGMKANQIMWPSTLTSRVTRTLWHRNIKRQKYREILLNLIANWRKNKAIKLRKQRGKISKKEQKVRGKSSKYLLTGLRKTN